MKRTLRGVYPKRELTRTLRCAQGDSERAQGDKDRRSQSGATALDSRSRGNDDGRKEIGGQYFEGVPPEAWNLHIGGYQVCEKWLKDRRGRTFTYEDLEHYSKVATALSETIRLMAEIDAAIPKWPIG